MRSSHNLSSTFFPLLSLTHLLCSKTVLRVCCSAATTTAFTLHSLLLLSLFTSLLFDIYSTPFQLNLLGFVVFASSVCLGNQSKAKPLCFLFGCCSLYKCSVVFVLLLRLTFGYKRTFFFSSKRVRVGFWPSQGSILVDLWATFTRVLKVKGKAAPKKDDKEATKVRKERVRERKTPNHFVEFHTFGALEDVVLFVKPRTPLVECLRFVCPGCSTGANERKRRTFRRQRDL